MRGAVRDASVSYTKICKDVIVAAFPVTNATNSAPSHDISNTQIGIWCLSNKRDPGKRIETSLHFQFKAELKHSLVEVLAAAFAQILQPPYSPPPLNLYPITGSIMRLRSGIW